MNEYEFLKILIDTNDLTFDKHTVSHHVSFNNYDVAEFIDILLLRKFIREDGEITIQPFKAIDQTISYPRYTITQNGKAFVHEETLRLSKQNAVEKRANDAHRLAVISLFFDAIAIIISIIALVVSLSR
jgi:hypothetical protein